jgi:hypothetical protein
MGSSILYWPNSCVWADSRVKCNAYVDADVIPNIAPPKKVTRPKTRVWSPLTPFIMEKMAIKNPDLPKNKLPIPYLKRKVVPLLKTSAIA